MNVFGFQTARVQIVFSFVFVYLDLRLIFISTFMLALHNCLVFTPQHLFVLRPHV